MAGEVEEHVDVVLANALDGMRGGHRSKLDEAAHAALDALASRVARAAVELIGKSLEAIAIQPLDEVGDQPRRRVIVKRRRGESKPHAPASRRATVRRRRRARREFGPRETARGDKLQLRVVADGHETKGNHGLPPTLVTGKRCDNRGTVALEIVPIGEVQLQLDALRGHLQARRIEGARTFQQRPRLLVTPLSGEQKTEIGEHLRRRGCEFQCAAKASLGTAVAHMLLANAEIVPDLRGRLRCIGDHSTVHRQRFRKTLLRE